MPTGYSRPQNRCFGVEMGETESFSNFIFLGMQYPGIDIVNQAL